MTNLTSALLGSVRDECLCLQVRRAARAAARLYDDALAPAGMTNGQFTLLALLGGNALIGMGDLAEEMGMDRSTVVAALKPLTEREWVTVSPDASDRRARNLALTAQGRRALQQALPLWQAAQAGMRSRVGPADLARLREDLAAMSA